MVNTSTDSNIVLHIFQNGKNIKDVQYNQQYEITVSNDPYEVRVGSGMGTRISSITYQKSGDITSFNVTTDQDVKDACFTVTAEMKAGA